MKVPDPASFVVYRGAKYYESLKKVIIHYDNSRREFYLDGMAGHLSILLLLIGA